MTQPSSTAATGDVVADLMSADGYFARPDRVDHLFDWDNSGEGEVRGPGNDMVWQVTPQSAGHLHGIFERAGALVVGRAPFSAVTKGVAAAIAQGKDVAGVEAASLSGPSIIQQALELDLVDQITGEPAPVPLGRGILFFGGLSRALLLDDPVVVEGSRVTHLRFRVRHGTSRDDN